MDGPTPMKGLLDVKRRCKCAQCQGHKWKPVRSVDSEVGPFGVPLGPSESTEMGSRPHYVEPRRVEGLLHRGMRKGCGSFRGSLPLGGLGMHSGWEVEFLAAARLLSSNIAS